MDNTWITTSLRTSLIRFVTTLLTLVGTSLLTRVETISLTTVRTIILKRVNNNVIHKSWDDVTNKIGQPHWLDSGQHWEELGLSFIRLDITHQQEMEQRHQVGTSDKGSQFCCRWVGRGSQPSSTPNAPPNCLSNSDKYTKASKTLISPLFNLCSQSKRPKDQQTDRQRDGWTMPLIELCVHN